MVWASAAPVYLTFDDGPHPVQTSAVLDVLAAYDARATFFVVGVRAASHPEIVERIVAEGHTVANHSWSHRTADTLTEAEFRESLASTQAQLGAHATACYRPPEFRLAPFVVPVLDELGWRLVMADANPHDWQPQGAEALAERIVALARPGAVIVLHDGLDRLGGQTAAALDIALRRLRAVGLRFEPVCG